MAKLRATVAIKKSFDDGKEFSKVWETDDFKEFFEQEGEYLDRLCKIMDEKGNIGDDFVVAYMVSVEKEN